jgi:glycosyltransferase involved in cell wall biosynthesis/SAM-dependent methyltransferase
MTQAETQTTLVSCIMPTANRRAFVAQAISYFLRQDYERKELIVVDDGEDAVGDLIPADERLRYLRLSARASVGAKRNLACEQARGEIIAHWDDDDWHAPHRLSYQLKALQRAGAELCGISTLLFYELRGGGRGWRYVYPARQKAWLSGSSLCYTRAFWAGNRFREINVGEDARFVWNRPAARMCALPDPSFHVGIIHKDNVSPKNTAGSFWQAHPTEDIRRVLGADAKFYDELAAGRSNAASVNRRNAQNNAQNNAQSDARDNAQSDAQKNVPSDVQSDVPNNAQNNAPGDGRKDETLPARVPVARDAPAALVTAAYGIGDILRVTPLVRVLSRLGYAVDLLVAPDYPESVKLWEGAPEIRRLYCYQNFRDNRGVQPLAAMAGEVYEVATFTQWSAPFRRWVKSKRVLAFNQPEWLRVGDSACVERMARELGWREDELPAPFAFASARKFALPHGTLALHPGCKPDWPWKKWHGFDELAHLWPQVAVIGTEADLRNEATYFRRDFAWPEHARNYVGALNLTDTAALIAQCAALVSNDSGMMHLGVALGTPTFGIFGITSPEREMIPSPQMFPVTKKLSCEAACRKKAWGRRDCERHLECLKTLSPEEVLAHVKRNVPALAAAHTADMHATNMQTADALAANPHTVNTHTVNTHAANAYAVNAHTVNALDLAPDEPAPVSSSPVITAQVAVIDAQVAAAPLPATVSPPRRAHAVDDLSLVYYGYVFDASGYGQAARGYIHALHRAGIKLSVVDLAANRPRQVRDELVEARIGRDTKADAHLFHGIPPQWARYAARVQNAIGMTVWETDAMPAQWQNALKVVREVWLPCDYNVSVFGKSLDKAIFKLPHVLLQTQTAKIDANDFLSVGAEDFVFYSIFEWQERKNPQGLMESFLRAFPAESDAVLILKVNREAAGLAVKELQQVRQQTGSRARVRIHSERWTETQIEALHARGDCYVSLHRGEGWCYPLFEAASRGTPVVATNYSGPLEYLNADAHQLVRQSLCPVRQSYIYYHTRMRWAEPDLTHAAQQLLRVYQERESIKAKAAEAARKLREDYSLERVGEMARARLEKIVGRRPAGRGRSVEDKAEHQRQLAPAVPIAGEWYDADYFEHGRKSNWERGYSWPLFSELFKRTANFLTHSFPEAESFLDAGCAKGFLVRALREEGKEAWGFDHSAWAIEHAEASSKNYLTRACAASVEFERQFDLTLAFSLCESLTEEQARAFLTRARGWTRQAIVAVIPSFESEEEERRLRKSDRDYSHITMRPRAWWHAEFLRAGWRQDALHRIVARACQQHELPRRMNWKVYVYAPA